jgi:hypothetical protein
MYYQLKAGAEVTFQSLHDFKFIVEEFNEHAGNVRCKYYDENLKRYIRLTLPAEAVFPVPKKKKLPQ